MGPCELLETWGPRWARGALRLRKLGGVGVYVSSRAERGLALSRPGDLSQG